MPTLSPSRVKRATNLNQGVPLAPSWHTATLVAVILAVALTGALLTRQGIAVPTAVASNSRIASRYLPMIVVAWSLLLYVCRAGRPRSALRALLGRGWTPHVRAGADIALGLCGWLLINAVELAWMRFLSAGVSASVSATLPVTWVEHIAWGFVAASVGFCEEVVFRGYLQAQLTACTRRASAALVLQAVLFALAHGEQGGMAMVRIALYGLALGALARWRRSLLPGIICHVLSDLASGWLPR